MMVKRKTLGQVRAYYRISDKRVRDALRGMRDVRNTDGAISMISDADIHRAADELVERYGTNAMSVALERVAEFSAKQDQPGVNVALRVLSALELLLGSR